MYYYLVVFYREEKKNNHYPNGKPIVEYMLYQKSESGDLAIAQSRLKDLSGWLGLNIFRNDTSLIGGYYVNSAGTSLIASPVELDKDGNA